MAENTSVLTAQETFGDDPVTGVGLMADDARVAARTLARAPRAWKDRALHLMADRIESRRDVILEANARDLERGREAGTSAALLDRLKLDEARIRGLADALRELAALPDPVGSVVRGQTLANGLRMRQAVSYTHLTLPTNREV